ncbi:mannitol dehydrogenase family protein [Rhizobium sp. P38BS-XIX]|uniref:mannitol dehydrogenase family protein n=1 Tax=Rhizobium sp. P38BS-XIX TaxID=2726740 RepID=UPI0014568D1E|nr:mannitol dehydrogenase family protein [Rhizobium sp. P38BS-XIX]NLS00993.1 mannitol dehydrogenase family protein [Rhizobium sp. P38BS-XIX]
MSLRLSRHTIGQLPDDVLRPGYERSAITPGIVHLGVGAFHRAHQAMYIDECLAAGQTGWGVIAVSLRSPQTRDALQPQDGLYTLAVRDGGGEALRVIGAVVDLLVAPEDPAAVIAAMANPDIRVVSLTVTEKAYLRDANGLLDLNDPDIRADLADPQNPRTIYGLITEALVRRRAAGHAPFTILSCDNLPANGHTLHRLLREFAAQRSLELARFVEHDVSCPSTMVDRIVPATTEADRTRIEDATGMTDAWPVVTEPFSEWVIEDRFPHGRPDWQPFGVTMVDDVAPFEVRKLRLLNGAHSAIAYLGQLLDLQTVSDAMAVPLVRQFVDGVWGELVPTLPQDKGLEPLAYTAKLTQRFSNTALKHRTAQIANDGSQKLPQRIIAAACERLSMQFPAEHLSFVVAAWIAALQGRSKEAAFSDPLDAQLANVEADFPDHMREVEAIFDVTGFAKAAPERSKLIDLVASHLKAIRDKGPEKALQELMMREEEQ